MQVIHTKQGVGGAAWLALRSLEGGVLDRSDGFLDEPTAGAAALSADDSCEGEGEGEGESGAGGAGAGSTSVAVGLQCLRFYNSDMWYTPQQLRLLGCGLSGAALDERVCFFSACLRLRRAERLLWQDTPLARLFTKQSEWHLLHLRGAIENIRRRLLERSVDPDTLFGRFDAAGEGSLSCKELVQMLKSVDTVMSPADALELARCLGNQHKEAEAAGAPMGVEAMEVEGAPGTGAGPPLVRRTLSADG